MTGRTAVDGAALRSAAPTLALIAIVIGAVALRAFPFLTPNTSVGSVEYDAGVYYSAAGLTFDGITPYQSFVLLHPPGIVLLLQPFVLLGSWIGDRAGFLAARVLILATSVLVVILVARVTSRWRGRWAGVLAAFVYTTGTSVLMSESTLLLEPLLNACCVGAALVVTGPLGRQKARTAGLAAGALLGAALAIKVWAAIYILVLAGRALVHRDRPLLAWLALSIAVTSAVLWLPFVLHDPSAFLEQVFQVQSARPGDGVLGISARLAAMASYGPFGGQSLLGPLGPIAGIAVTVIAAVWAVVRGGDTGVTWVAILVATTGFFLVSPAYYLHYGAFVAPAAAVVIGAWAARMLEWVAATRRRSTIAVAALVVVGVVGLTTVRTLRLQSQVVGPGGDYGAAVSALVSPGSCIAADDPTWLVLANRRPRPGAGDPPIADLFGVQNVAALSSGDRFASSDELLQGPAAQKVLRGYLEACPFALIGLPLDTWSPDTRAFLEEQFRVVADWSADGGPQLWRRR